MRNGTGKNLWIWYYSHWMCLGRTRVLNSYISLLKLNRTLEIRVPVDVQSMQALEVCRNGSDSVIDLSMCKFAWVYLSTLCWCAGKWEERFETMKKVMRISTRTCSILSIYRSPRNWRDLVRRRNGIWMGVVINFQVNNGVRVSSIMKIAI